MPTYKSIKAYRAAQTQKIKKLKQDKDQGPKVTSKLVAVTARKLAPRRSGETIRGIRRRKRKKGWTVESHVSGAFKQNLWANQTAPFRTPKMRWNKGQKTLYGQGPARWTGTARFFHFATVRNRKKNLQVTRKNTLKTLRLQF